MSTPDVPLSNTLGAVAPPAFEGLPTPRRYWAVATVLCAVCLAVLDVSIANIALPTITTDLKTSPANAVWVVNAYNITVVMFLLPFSAIAEKVGFRRMFGLGLVLFTAASLSCAMSGSLVTLTLSRMFQGIGAASLMSLMGGLVRNIYPLNRLGFGMSINATMVALMSVLGPTLGSAILSIAPWPWIFAINVPIGIVAVFGLKHLPDVPTHDRRFDWQSALLCMLTLGVFIVAVDFLSHNLLVGVSLLILCAVTGVLLIQRVRPQSAPLVPIDLLRIDAIAFAVAASVFTFAAQMTSFVALPFYFQEVLGRPYLQVGMLMGAWPLGTALIAVTAGRVADRFPVGMLSSIGAAVMLSGLTWILVLPRTASNAWIIAGMFITGLGFGFFQTPNSRSMLSSAPRSRSGVAGGLQATTRVFGQSLGTALVATAFTLAGSRGNVVAMGISAFCALCALGVCLVRWNKRDHEE
jgi:DHA2 family multidrug resistance protein-like MFS transporter